MNNDPQQKIILNQIAGRLHEIFDGLIDMSDVNTRDSTAIEHRFLSRALAALCIMSEAGVSAAVAGSSVCDGGSDDGIDAVYVDAPSRRIYLCQSKWRTNMNRGLELSEFTRFRDGARNLLSLNWNDDNALLHRFSKDIEARLNDLDTDVVLLIADTSAQKIADNIRSKIDEFTADQNKYNTDFLFFKEFRVQQASKAARTFTRPENINVDLMLAHWGIIDQPYRAVYGSIAAADLALWFSEHGNKLFSENLRFGIEKSSVNDGIAHTAASEPENFWYFNNGVTAICDAFFKKPIGGNETASGLFHATKLSIINGAQTITTLKRTMDGGADLGKAKVLIRVISLDATADDFSSKVTNANNTQNDLSPVDFVAADPNQERIKKEAAQIGLVYTYRRGERDPAGKDGFTIRSATIAAACASGDLKLAVQAKRYISGLWENTSKEPYTKLFNPNISAKYLWNIVNLMRFVDEALEDRASQSIGREKLIAIHSNRFVLYNVFEKLKTTDLAAIEEIEKIREEIRGMVDDFASKLRMAIEEKFPDAYPGNIFKNQDRQTELLAEISRL